MEDSSTTHGRNPSHILSAIPWHAQCVALLLLAICTQSCAAWLSNTHNSTSTSPQETAVLMVLFPQLFSLRAIGVIRLLFSGVIGADCVYAFLYGSWDQETVYDKHRSKLKGMNIPFRGILRHPKRSLSSGIATLSSFTMVSWMFLGLGFFFAGTSAYLASQNSVVPHWWIQSALILWECAAPSAVLVSTTVKYVLWPMALQYQSSNANVFAHPLTLLEHNGNSIMVLIEMTMLGGLPLDHVEIVVLFGLLYVIGSWCMMYGWSEDGSAQFLYPFFDVTLGWRSTAYLLVLLIVLVVYFFLLSKLSWILRSYCDDAVGSLVALVAGIALTCRWRN